MNETPIRRVISTFGSAILATPFYRPLRFAYQSLFNRSQLRIHTKRKAFFSTLIESGDIVIDVGANIGEYSEIFHSLGGRVIAVEPDPRNLSILTKRSRGRFTIEDCALGPKEGQAVLNMASYGGVSTLSDDWVNCTPAEWIGTTSVRMSTLDELARKYGIPKYVKIDVELFDYDVLCGMSFQPSVVSFEYQRSRLDVAAKCVTLLQERWFNFVPEGQMVFELPHWVTATEIITQIEASTSPSRYGDVFSIANTVQSHLLAQRA